MLVMRLCCAMTLLAGTLLCAPDGTRADGAKTGIRTAPSAPSPETVTPKTKPADSPQSEPRGLQLQLGEELLRPLKSSNAG